MKPVLIFSLCFVLGFVIALGCGVAKRALKDPVKREIIAGGADKGAAIATGVAAERFAAGDWIGGIIGLAIGTALGVGGSAIRKKFQDVGGSKSADPGGTNATGAGSGGSP